MTTPPMPIAGDLLSRAKHCLPLNCHPSTLRSFELSSRATARDLLFGCSGRPSDAAGKQIPRRTEVLLGMTIQASGAGMHGFTAC